MSTKENCSAENTLQECQALLLDDIDNCKHCIIKSLPEGNTELRKALLELYRDFQNVEVKVVGLKGN